MIMVSFSVFIWESPPPPAPFPGVIDGELVQSHRILLSWALNETNYIQG